jgi:hypothetical protein
MGLVTMTGSVMKATHGTEPAIEGAAQTTPAASAMVQAARRGRTRPSSPPGSWAGCYSPVRALTTSTAPVKARIAYRSSLGLALCRPGPGPLPLVVLGPSHQQARPPQGPTEICWSSPHGSM